jgi:hypothetical protein
MNPTGFHPAASDKLSGSQSKLWISIYRAGSQNKLIWVPLTLSFIAIPGSAREHRAKEKTLSLGTSQKTETRTDTFNQGRRSPHPPACYWSLFIQRKRPEPRVQDIPHMCVQCRTSLQIQKSISSAHARARRGGWSWDRGRDRKRHDIPDVNRRGDTGRSTIRKKGFRRSRAWRWFRFCVSSDNEADGLLKDHRSGAVVWWQLCFVSLPEGLFC